MSTDLSGDVAEAAKAIEHAADARDAGLIGDDVLGVDVTAALDGSIKEITVHFNSRGVALYVDLCSGAVEGAAGMNSHRVPLFEGDDKNTEAVLSEAREWWEMTINGTEMSAH